MLGLVSLDGTQLYFGHYGEPAGAHSLIADRIHRREEGTDGDATSHYSF